MGKKRTYTDKEFVQAVKSSASIRQVLKKLNLRPAGGNYRSCHNRIQRLGLDSSHFTGQGHSKGKIFGPKRPIEDYLSNKHRVQSNNLKARLITEGFFEHKCYQCGLIAWNGQSIPIELEHKDGDHYNNNLSNLTILCPNCHAQTDTYKGKNKRK